MGTVIKFSAQFAGKDAAEAVLPHLRALKCAASDLEVAGLPLPDLTFILRVDGSVRSFGLQGAGNVDLDRGGAYVSIDIGITIADRESLQDADDNPIVKGILDAIPLLAGIGDPKLEGADFTALKASLQTLCERYRAVIADRGTSSLG